MAEVQHRTRTEPVYDGSTGAKVHERTIHELGVEHNGEFVAFLSKEGDYLDRQAELAKSQRSDDAEPASGEGS